MHIIVPLPRPATILAIVTLAFLPAVSQAEDSSPWIVEAHSSARLLAGSRNGSVMLGGIDIKLDKGWKTYWRTPGDSGVAPRFDFSKSDNIESVTVLWPAPRAFPDGAGGIVFGYHDEVVIPLRISVHSPDKPATLRAQINYAICDKLCVPVDSDLTMQLVSVASTADALLTAALDKVPKPANIGDPLPLTIRDVKRVGKKSVEVDVVAQDDKTDLKNISLFAEGPTPDWALPIPKLAPRQPKGLRRYVFDLDGLPPGTDPTGSVIKLTLADPTHAYEFNVTLD